MKFELSASESQAASVFMDSHGPKCKYENEYLGAIGGRWMYEIVETSIGPIINIKCVCGEREFIGDIP
jgi:hypothetical protein